MSAPPFDPTPVHAHLSPSEADFVTLLAEQQATLGLSNTAFARKLQVSQATWSQARNGRSRVGLSLIVAGSQCFPAELASKGLGFLLSVKRERKRRSAPGGKTA